MADGEPLARWTQLVQGPEDELPLDEAALIVAWHGNPNLDIPGQLRRLDAIAASAGADQVEAVCRLLFDELGLRGNAGDYSDPRNSYLDQVLDRRQGIPISLSVLLIEVGRRRGLPLEGVGMPGHFLVRDRRDPDRLIDAFNGGARLDQAACQRLLRSVAGPDAELTGGMLAATPARAILARMLANLDRSFEQRSDFPSLGWVCDLRRAIPGRPLGDRVQLARRLGGLGRFDEAAEVLEELEARPALEERLQHQIRAEATGLRARSN